MRWSTGYALWTSEAAWLPPTMFGFSGLGGSMGFADTATGPAFGYVMNRLADGFTPDPESRGRSPRPSTASRSSDQR